MLMLGLRPGRSFFVLVPVEGEVVLGAYIQVTAWGYRQNSEIAELHITHHGGPRTLFQPRVLVSLGGTVHIEPELTVAYVQKPAGAMVARYGITAPRDWRILRDTVVIDAGLRALLGQPPPVSGSRLSSLQPG